MDKTILRQIVRDTLTAKTAEDFLATWGQALTDPLFAKAQGLQGQILLAEVRWLAVQAQKPAGAPVSVKGANGKGGKSNVPAAPGIDHVNVVILDGSTQVEAKSFDSSHKGLTWAARKVAENPGYSARVGSKILDRDEAIRIAWGGKQTAPVLAKRPGYAGPWQKAQQTRVVLPK